MHTNKRTRGKPAASTHGFTVIELLATTVIAAILMLAVLTVVGQLGRDQVRLARRESQAGPDQIVQLLSKDLARATSLTVDVQTGAVVLEGYGALDPTTFVPTGRAARVTYQMQNSDGGQWLVRKQTPLDEAYSRSWTEYVSPAIKKLTMAPQPPPSTIAGPGNVASEAANPQMIGEGGATTVYNQVRLHIQWADASRAPLDQWIVLR